VKFFAHSSPWRHHRLSRLKIIGTVPIPFNASKKYISDPLVFPFFASLSKACQRLPRIYIHIYRSIKPYFPPPSISPPPRNYLPLAQLFTPRATIYPHATIYPSRKLLAIIFVPFAFITLLTSILFSFFLLFIFFSFGRYPSFGEGIMK
jgi:hypothetical protein